MTLFLSFPQTSNAVAFNYDVAVITNVAPRSGATNGGNAIVVTGSGFNAGASVAIGGVNCPLQAGGQTSTQRVCLVPAGQGRNFPITVTSGTYTTPGTIMCT